MVRDERDEIDPPRDLPMRAATLILALLASADAFTAAGIKPGAVARASSVQAQFGTGNYNSKDMNSNFVLSPIAASGDDSNNVRWTQHRAAPPRRNPPVSMPRSPSPAVKTRLASPQENIFNVIFNGGFVVAVTPLVFLGLAIYGVINL